MSEDSELRRGDVVIVRLAPAEGHEMKKTRPAVVVQNDVGNTNASTTIVAPATGTYRGYPFEILVEAAESPFEKNSSIRLDQIRVISIEKRIHSVLGSLDTETMETVDEALKLSLGLD
ncbi:type II toxin-antitoxin system PemK/MazF family toxin [Natronobacterium gregoryi]|uniref:Growth inhibitor n=2 Tax=Natronobacterium gregoryi TaxID=44930 RepID=L0AEJ7_NATGS|nr:type II toxin-antitoxin system PemK/MazF family toxin [Natronobacterium gregoryi]AFZ71485.1 growth inhibitor [Natronobacterium gregoryi SP2]ELY66787.1 MazF family transcriptional regulator [Natronobacterium gregoryi SP2]PLK17878.1 type II toxin-antitoxin system PemK/MazF family toxin [Natronobacterium gregoryi SP2]SFJ74868.1 mRNA interferase MazF [Natronobacterium gregoryi]